MDTARCSGVQYRIADWLGRTASLIYSTRDLYLMDWLCDTSADIGTASIQSIWKQAHRSRIWTTEFEMERCQLARHIITINIQTSLSLPVGVLHCSIVRARLRE